MVAMSKVSPFTTAAFHSADGQDGALWRIDPAANSRIPYMPRFEIVKVPPASSSRPSSPAAALCQRW